MIKINHMSSAHTITTLVLKLRFSIISINLTKTNCSLPPIYLMSDINFKLMQHGTILSVHGVLTIFLNFFLSNLLPIYTKMIF
jgi:hypothetical protein